MERAQCRFEIGDAEDSDNAQIKAAFSGMCTRHVEIWRLMRAGGGA